MVLVAVMGDSVGWEGTLGVSPTWGEGPIYLYLTTFFRVCQWSMGFFGWVWISFDCGKESGKIKKHPK